MGIYLSCASMPASASVINDIVSVTPVIQAKSKWCWAACAEMCGKTIAPSSTRTQYDVVRYITGNTSDVGGDMIDCGLGCEYVGLFKKSFTVGSMDFSVISLHTNKKEALVAFGVPKSSDSSTDDLIGHTFLICGSQFIDNGGNSIFNIDYINPSNGKRYHCSYESFRDGSYTGFTSSYMAYTQ